MLSYLEMDEGAEVPWHSHPHEQGGILIRGRVQLSIGDETRTCEAGSMFIIPPNVRHRAVAVGGPAVVLDSSARGRRLRRDAEQVHSAGRLVTRRAGEKRIGSACVLRVFRSALADPLLQQHDARDLEQQSRHHDGAENRRPGAARGGNDVQAPPNAAVAEVVGVPRVAPETLVEHAPAVGGIGLEARELPIAAGFGTEADQPSTTPHASSQPTAHDSQSLRRTATAARRTTPTSLGAETR